MPCAGDLCPGAWGHAAGPVTLFAPVPPADGRPTGATSRAGPVAAGCPASLLSPVLRGAAWPPRPRVLVHSGTGTREGTRAVPSASPPRPPLRRGPPPWDGVHHWAEGELGEVTRPPADVLARAWGSPVRAPVLLPPPAPPPGRRPGVSPERSGRLYSVSVLLRFWGFGAVSLGNDSDFVKRGVSPRGSPSRPPPADAGDDGGGGHALIPRGPRRLL